MGRQETAEQATFPATSASITQAQMQDTVNSLDVEDAVKYLPGLFIRKRNYGDTQPVIATRNWGVNASARTLVYVDDIPITALIANNNTMGAPRWGMVSPEEIDHTTLLYGPYSAEYSGNAMGGVLRIVTRSPQRTEVTLDQTGALQSFDLYDTHDTYGTSQTSLTAGGRAGDLSWFVAGSFQASDSQPLAFVTAASPPAGTQGAILATNKVGQPADVLGAAGLLHTRQTSLLARVGYSLSSVWELTSLIGFWHNSGNSDVATYLTDADSQPTYGRASGFASNHYDLAESHLMTALSLKSDSHTTWDAEAVATFYDFIEDRQLSPAGVTTGTAFTPNGRLADYAGTEWGTLDLKGIWRPSPTIIPGSQEITLGLHADRYTLRNPTLNTQIWQDSTSGGGTYSSARGRTETTALWLQDVWTPRLAWQATLGIRAEHWRASDGYDYASAASGNVGIVQPPESATGVSPKASLRWQPAEDWSLTASFARAIRFPTVGELYQLVSTGSTYASPNPDLAPERDLSGELALVHSTKDGSARLSFFQENTQDALISQTTSLPGYAVPVTYVVNVGEVRNRGIEIAAQQSNLFIQGFDLEGSLTFVDSTILSDPEFSSTAGTTADGKHAPYVPKWRATLVATYRPSARWAVTLAGRYSGTMYSTLDNTDTTSDVFGAFDSFLVLDARIHWQASPHLALALGVDNLNNREYFLYHPFPQRTVIADIHLKL